MLHRKTKTNLLLKAKFEAQRGVICCQCVIYFFVQHRGKFKTKVLPLYNILKFQLIICLIFCFNRLRKKLICYQNSPLNIQKYCFHHLGLYLINLPLHILCVHLQKFLFIQLFSKHFYFKIHTELQQYISRSLKWTQLLHPTNHLFSL